LLRKSDLTNFLPSWSLPLTALTVSSGAFFWPTRQLQTNLFTSLMFLTGLSMLCGFILKLHKDKEGDLTAVRSLTRDINGVATTNVATQLMVTKAANSDIQKLAVSCNGLIEYQFDKLQQMLQFTAAVTHELRTPLTVLRGETEVALHYGKNRHQLNQILESNLEEINRMSSLIDDLLTTTQWFDPRIAPPGAAPRDNKKYRSAFTLSTRKDHTPSRQSPAAPSHPKPAG